MMQAQLKPEISGLFISILDLARRSRAAEISFTFKQRLRSLLSVLFLEGNDEESRLNYYESIRLFCLGWSINCRLEDFV